MRQKGVHLLLDAWSRLAPAFPDVALVVVGFGDARAELESMPAERVIFTGAMDHEHLHLLVPLADAVVVPSVLAGGVRDGRGRGGGSCGVLPIVADHSGLAEVAAGLGENGLTFDGTAADLEARLAGVLALPRCPAPRDGPGRARGRGRALELGRDRAAPDRRSACPDGARISRSKALRHAAFDADSCHVAPSLRLGLRRLAGRRHPRPAPPTHEDARLGLLADALFDAVFVHVNGRIAEVNRRSRRRSATRPRRRSISRCSTSSPPRTTTS